MRNGGVDIVEQSDEAEVKAQVLESLTYLNFGNASADYKATALKELLALDICPLEVEWAIASPMITMVIESMRSNPTVLVNNPKYFEKWANLLIAFGQRYASLGVEKVVFNSARTVKSLNHRAFFIHVDKYHADPSKLSTGDVEYMRTYVKTAESLSTIVPVEVEEFTLWLSYLEGLIAR